MEQYLWVATGGYPEKNQGDVIDDEDVGAGQAERKMSVERPCSPAPAFSPHCSLSSWKLLGLSLLMTFAKSKDIFWSLCAVFNSTDQGQHLS